MSVACLARIRPRGTRLRQVESVTLGAQVLVGETFYGCLNFDEAADR